jgi:hypothetical protein
MSGRSKTNNKRKAEQIEQDDQQQQSQDDQQVEQQVEQPKKERVILTSQEYAAKKQREERELKKNVLKYLGNWKSTQHGETTISTKEHESKEGKLSQRVEAQVLVEVVIVDKKGERTGLTSTKAGTASGFFDINKPIGTWHFTSVGNNAVKEATNECLKELWEMKQLELEIEAENKIEEQKQSQVPLLPTINNNN